jgi:hypothetical protein
VSPQHNPVPSLSIRLENINGAKTLVNLQPEISNANALRSISMRLAHGTFAAPPKVKKVFLVLFLQKKNAFLALKLADPHFSPANAP